MKKLKFVCLATIFTLAMSTFTHADMVVVNGRYVWSDTDLHMKVYQNDGCRIVVNFLRKNQSDGLYACTGKWEWNEIEKMTHYYRDKINIDKTVIYSNVIRQSQYQCKELERNSVNVC
ncbi:MAG: hypothetical protein JJ891_16185 [Rhizobiaceae bacterium]|jgi:hypothetical protein|nr:hypothetical protein [Rhizobiaceae bacterium]